MKIHMRKFDMTSRLQWTEAERDARKAMYVFGQQLYKDGKPLPKSSNLLVQDGYYSMVRNRM